MLKARPSLRGAALLLLAGCADPISSSQTARITTDSAGAAVLARHVSARSVGTTHGGLHELELSRHELTSASRALHDELDRCAGFMLEEAPLPEPRRERALALQVDYTVDNGATVAALLAPLQESNLRQTIQGLSDFPTRFHESEEGYAASLWIRDRWQAHAADRSDVTVALVEHERTPQPSISLTITGSKFPEQLVILGGHMDSINRQSDLAPGADDNASGIAVLEEVIRSAMLNEYRPDRTVVFYAYAAEEIGLVGSAEIALDAAERELEVAGVLQLDMTNYNPAPNPYLALVTDYTDEALTAYARTLIETYVELPWQNTECGYACSDHGSWQRRGFPVHYVHEARTSESNDEIHTERDTLELSDGSAQHSLYFAQYSAAFMAELAKGTVPECSATRACPAGEQCNGGTCEPIPSVSGVSGGAGTAGSAGSSAAGAPSGGAGGSAGAPTIAGMPAIVAGGAAPVAMLPSAPVTPSASESGCACRTTTNPSAKTPLLGFLLSLLALTLRRSRLRSRPLHGVRSLRPSPLRNEV